MTDDGRRGPGRAVVAGVGLAALVALLIFAATRTPAPVSPPAPPSGAPSAAVPPARAPLTGAGKTPASTPSNAPAAGGKAVTPSAAAPTRSAPASPAPAVNPSDLPPGHPAIVADDKTQVGIQWLGHSCFYIDSPGGVAVVTDPFDPKATGLAAPATGAHFITVSEETPEHDFAGAVHAFQGERKEVLHGRPARRGDLKITPVPTDSSAAGNVAYLIEAGTLRIVHLGALDHRLGAAQAKPFGPVDVLMLPVGGRGLSPKDAVAVAKSLNPRIVLPMAYSTPDMKGPAARLRPLQDFISASPYAVTRKDQDVMMVSRADLPQTTEIYTLKYGR